MSLDNKARTIDELLDLSAPKEELLFLVLREPITPREILYKFAADVAKRTLKRVQEQFPGDRAFSGALEAAESADKQKIDSARKAIERTFHRAASAGAGRDILNVIKTIRAAVKQEPHLAASGASFHALRNSEKPEKELVWQVERLKILTREI